MRLQLCCLLLNLNGIGATWTFFNRDQAPADSLPLGELTLDLSKLTDQEPYCKLPVVENGWPDTQWPAVQNGTLVKWACNVGYTLFGSSLSVCYNGVLVPLPVYSVRPVCLPGCTVPQISHGRSSVSIYLKYHQKVTFSCNEGSMLQGPQTLHCKKSGVLNDTAPECVQIPGMSKGFCDILASDWRLYHGAKATLRCGDRRRSVKTVKCLQGELTPAFHCVDPDMVQVQEVRCLVPLLAKGHYIGNVGHYVAAGDVVTVKCPRAAPEVMVCKHNGRLPVTGCNTPGALGRGPGFLRGDKPKMIPIQGETSPKEKKKRPKLPKYYSKYAEGDRKVRRRCVLPMIKNGRVVGQRFPGYMFPVIMVGDIVRYQCNEGFLIRGPQAARCNPHLILLPPPGLCVRTCTMPELENGKVLPKRLPILANDEVAFECSSAYKLIGSAKAVCSIDGTLDLPQCVRVCSTVELLPPLGLKATGYPAVELGGAVEVYCWQDMVTTGSKVAKCELVEGSPVLTSLPLCTDAVSPEWSVWEECSAECGKGITLRRRGCEGEGCVDIETKPCYIECDEGEVVTKDDDGDSNANNYVEDTVDAESIGIESDNADNHAGENAVDQSFNAYDHVENDEVAINDVGSGTAEDDAETIDIANHAGENDDVQADVVESEDAESDYEIIDIGNNVVQSNNVVDTIESDDEKIGENENNAVESSVYMPGNDQNDDENIDENNDVETDDEESDNVESGEVDQQDVAQSSDNVENQYTEWSEWGHCNCEKGMLSRHRGCFLSPWDCTELSQYQTCKCVEALKMEIVVDDNIVDDEVEDEVDDEVDGVVDDVDDEVDDEVENEVDEVDNEVDDEVENEVDEIDNEVDLNEVQNEVDKIDNEVANEVDGVVDNIDDEVENAMAQEDWFIWSGWSNCNVECGRGLRRRSKICLRETPHCNALVSEDEYQTCTLTPCRVAWSEWSECSASCGVGERRREIVCTEAGCQVIEEVEQCLGTYCRGGRIAHEHQHGDEADEKHW